MKRMTILLVLSTLASLMFNAVVAGQDDFCTYSSEVVDTYYEGCFCDYEGTHLCAGSGYMLYIYTCDGPCYNCWNCNYWKDSNDSVLGKLYPVCHSIHAAAPWCGADSDCERESWRVDMTAAPLCRCG